MMKNKMVLSLSVQLSSLPKPLNKSKNTRMKKSMSLSPLKMLPILPRNPIKNPSDLVFMEYTMSIKENVLQNHNQNI